MLLLSAFARLTSGWPMLKVAWHYYLINYVTVGASVVMDVRSRLRFGKIIQKAEQWKFSV